MESNLKEYLYYMLTLTKIYDIENDDIIKMLDCNNINLKDVDLITTRLDKIISDKIINNSMKKNQENDKNLFDLSILLNVKNISYEEAYNIMF